VVAGTACRGKNIGIHFFDLLLWLFGGCEQSHVHLRDERKMAGSLILQRARVRWFLSTDAEDLPSHCVRDGKFAHRSMTLDGQEIEFSSGFANLHTKVYEEVLAGRGCGIADARPAIELVHAINHADVVNAGANAHPMLATTRLSRASVMQRRAA